ncbi:MAG: hypothetical protein LC135_04305 [Phycisphaerae bacterium]|nr:hypothetical protein [Phycisphaerae bacterium]MCZ2399075.1 hypothetical protein [Phycisphaerae bacterium]NUQ50801.1 hypothetical protein [Phycisphaerae bacterium]
MRRSAWIVTLGGLMTFASFTAGFPFYLETWISVYPSSTLPARMLAQAGSQCRVCHQPPDFGAIGNCYREDIKTLLGKGLTIQEAILALETVDSDGDGVSNRDEFLSPHVDFPGEIGYNAGLVGPLGVGPCGDHPEDPVSGVLETPPAPGCPHPGCTSDVTGDCKVGQEDLGVLLAAFGSTPEQTHWNPAVDFDGDGHIGQTDLGLLLSEFGNNCN